MAVLPIIILILFSILIIIALSVFMVISNWKLFVKCGRKGWECLIPYYNTYIMCKISGSKIMWGIILMVLPTVMSIISNAFEVMGTIFQNSDFAAGFIAIIVGLLSVAALVVTYIASFIIYINLAKRFDKSTGYGIGMTLLPIVFIPMLAFGKDVYHKAPANN